MKQRRPRVAYVVSHPIQYQAPLLRKIASSGIDLDVFFLSDYSTHDHRDTEFGCKVEWDIDLVGGYRHTMLACDCKNPPGFFTGNPRDLVRRIWQREFDVVWVHGWSYMTNLLALIAANLGGVPTLLRGEARLDVNRAKSAFWNLLYRTLISLGSAYLYIGSENRRFYEAYGARDGLLFSMPYCVDNDFFQMHAARLSSQRAAMREKWGLHPNRPAILYAGKLTHRKKADCLLDAYARLCKTAADTPPPYLMYVGDGPLRSALEDKAAAEQLGGVRFFGFRNQAELCEFYVMCDVFVLASENEPWGLAVNEAMNFARPVIVSDQVGAAADLVSKCDTGFIVKAGDSGELCDALHRVLEPSVRDRLGSNALSRINTWSYIRDINGLAEAVCAVLAREQADATAISKNTAKRAP